MDNCSVNARIFRAQVALKVTTKYYIQYISQINLHQQKFIKIKIKNTWIKNLKVINCNEKFKIAKEKNDSEQS